MLPRRVTTKQIADAAHVSRTTVSFVLNNRRDQNISEATWKRVLETARELGYRADRQPQSNGVALLVRRSVTNVVQAAFLMEALRGLSLAVEPRGYEVGLHELADGDHEYEDWLRSNAFSGAILFNVLLREREQLKQLAVNSCCSIVSIHSSGVAGIPFAGIDNSQAAFEAVRYLIGLGHRRIGAILYAPQEHVISYHRWQGYRHALEQYGLDYDEHYVVAANFTSDSGYTAALTLLAQVPEPPTAVFATSDIVALGAMQAIRERGFSIPEDISVVGFDDVPIARFFHPPLTTVRQPGVDIGLAAGELLLRLMNGETGVPSVLLSFQLMERESACPCQERIGL